MNIVLQNISKTFMDATRDLCVITDLNYSFHPKSSTVILGKSGIGKSTLLYLMAGLESPTGGEIMMDDTRFSQLTQDELARFRLNSIGFIFQFHHLLNDFDAVENVAMPLRIAGVARNESKERAIDSLRRVGLGERLNSRPGQLSGGEQQRVAIARSVAMTPKLILADEPTGNLDVENAEIVTDLLLDLTQSSQATLVIVTHNHELASKSDYVLEMQPGGTLIEK